MACTSRDTAWTGAGSSSRIEPFFSKFIEWQFGILNEKGYLVKGKHPVGWCPNDNNAVGMHDTKHDVEPEIAEGGRDKVRRGRRGREDGLRHIQAGDHTGVTNIFVDERAQYVLCEMGNEKCYVSRPRSRR